MKVIKASVLAGQENLKNDYVAKNKKYSKSGGSIDGRNLSTCIDPLTEKKKQARQKAMKIIGDAFAGDQKIDNDIEERRQRIRDLNKELGENNKAIREIENKRAALREEYGIDPESQEEKDLQLLAKGVEASFIGSKISLTAEEREQISKIYEAGLTEYQQRSLEMKRYEAPYAEAATKAEKEIMMENSIITGIKLERLKTNVMGKAQKQADAVMDAASDEIKSMLIEEAKENIDDDMEKKKEKAEKQAKKQEELEERLEAAKERKKEQEELLENILDAASEITGKVREVSDAQQEIKNMMSKMKLIEEDIKGAAIDQEV